MWQRVQTIFLSIIAICMITMPFMVIWQGTDGSNEITLSSLYLLQDGNKVYFPYALVTTLAIAAFTIALIEITKYKNRITQIKLGALNSLLMAASMVIPFLFVRELEETYRGAYGIGMFFPAVALICNSIANRFIRKDERLVRESDRLR